MLHKYTTLNKPAPSSGNFVQWRTLTFEPTPCVFSVSIFFTFTLVDKVINEELFPGLEPVNDVAQLESRPQFQTHVLHHHVAVEQQQGLAVYFLQTTQTTNNTSWQHNHAPCYTHLCVTQPKVLICFMYVTVILLRCILFIYWTVYLLSSFLTYIQCTYIITCCMTGVIDVYMARPQNILKTKYVID